MAKLTEQNLSEPLSIGGASTSRRHHLVGRPSNNRNTPENFPRRFWKRVVRRGDHECWPWHGSKLPTGRGQVHLRWEGGKSIRKNAPVVAWELTHGPVPAGKVVAHVCDDPNCCNVVNHLFLATQAENVHDCIYKERRNAFGRQKLQVSDVLELRRLARLGAPRAFLAQRFGIKPHSVTEIVARRSWGWLTDPGLQNVEPLGQARADFDQLAEQIRRADVVGHSQDGNAGRGESSTHIG